MARVHIEQPDRFIFSTVLPVRITDLNYGNHLGNDSLMSLMHEARVRFLQYFGFSELDVAGAGIIMADAAIQYKHEAFYGDQLTIEIAVADISRVSFDLIYRITCNTQEIAIAKTGIVCYDYSKKKVTAIPDAFIVSLRG